MKKIKVKVSTREGTGKAILRIALAVIFGCMVAGVLIMAVVKFLGFCLVPQDTLTTIERLLWSIGIPAALVNIAVYILHTLRRRYAYSYMLDYHQKFKSNGYNRCPRCGSGTTEKTGRGSYQQRVGDRVTTRTYSDGRKEEVSREGIYRTKYYTYQYCQCNNATCALRNDVAVEFGKMPYSTKDLRMLILREHNPKKKNAAYLVTGGGQGLWKALAIVAALLLVIGGLMFRSNMSSVYGQFGGKDVEGIDVTAPFGEGETKLMSDVRGIIDGTEEYGLYVSEVSTGLFAKDKDVDIYRFADEPLGIGYTVKFSGIESDSGLKGEYTIMDYQGQICLLRDEDETAYAPDSEFYNTHYASVAKWTEKSVITDLLDRVTTGQLYENYDDMFVLRGDGISLFIAEDGSVRLLDETGEKTMRYIFTPQDTQKPDNYADYRPEGYEDTETDELQKILNKASHDADISWTIGGKDAGELDVNDNGDGTYTFRNSYNPTDQIPMGEYVLYPTEKRYAYYKFENTEYYTLTDTPELYTQEDAPDIYGWLCDMIPENFVKAHINLENAKKQSAFGLATVYTEDQGDGKKAVLEVQGDDVSFEYYEDDDTCIEIDW